MSETRGQPLDDMGRVQDEFLSILFHELRTPLTPILAWAQLLKRTNDPAHVAQAAQVIERNVRSQMAIVDDVLDLNRVVHETLRLEPRRHDLRDIVQAAVASARENAAEKNIRIDLLIAAKNPLTANVDRSRAEQAVRYLVLNAVRFTPTDGAVTVSLRGDAEQATITLQDAGPPIPDDHLPRAFEAFQEGHLAGRIHGTAGIQLALARGLIELHGGEVRVTSPGIGAEIAVLLPLARKRRTVAPGRGSGEAATTARSATTRAAIPGARSDPS